jgi:WD40 repeat protein
LVPAPADLAKLTAAADALKRENIPEELLKKIGDGDKDKALAELVAVFGEDRHAAGDKRCHLTTVAVSPNGKLLAFGGLERVVHLIDLATGKPRQKLIWNDQPLVGHVYHLAFSPDSKMLACATTDAGSIVLWDVQTGMGVRALPNHDNRVNQLAFSPDGSLLASAAENRGVGTVRLWKPTGELLFTSPPMSAWSVWSVAFSPDGKTLAAGLETGEVRLFDVAIPAAGWQLAKLAGHGGPVRWLGFHPDGRSLVVAGGLTENTVFVWDLATRPARTQPARLSGHHSGVLSGAWRADGRLITAGDTDGTVRLWDLSGDQPRSRALAVIPPKVPWLHGIALSPEGRHLAVCNPNGTVYVLRLAPPGQVFEVPADGAK